jgi:hypothetical protein
MFISRVNMMEYVTHPALLHEMFLERVKQYL